MNVTTEPVTLLVNGQRHEGWKDVRVTCGLDRAARDFDVSITRNWPDQQRGTSLPITIGDGVVLMLGADRVMTGYVDATPVRYDANSLTLGIAGRSKTADLIDCSAADSPGQWTNARVEQIAQALAAPYGVTVRTETPTGEPIPDHQVQQGETAFESVDRLLRARQLLATDDAEGALVLVAAGGQQADTALSLGQNILSADYACSGRDLFATYVCKGQGSGNDQAFGADVSEASGRATDIDIKRNRYLVLQQSGQADNLTCQERAAYERDLRKARARTVVYTVQGWRQDSGALWTPNLLVQVTDSWCGINRRLLLSEVTYALGDQGTRCSLTLLPAEAYVDAQKRRSEAT